MVRRARLLAHAVGAVREGDALARQSAGGKDSLAREQGAFLFQIQFFDEVGMFHKNFPSSSTGAIKVRGLL